MGSTYVEGTIPARHTLYNLRLLSTRFFSRMTQFWVGPNFSFGVVCHAVVSEDSPWQHNAKIWRLVELWQKHTRLLDVSSSSYHRCYKREKHWQDTAACHESICACAFCLSVRNKQTPSDSHKELLNKSLLTIVNSQNGDSVRRAILFKCSVAWWSDRTVWAHYREFWLYIADDLLIK